MNDDPTPAELRAGSPDPTTTRVIHAIYTRADRVEHFPPHWWVHFVGSWETLRFGEEKPFEPGDLVKITFEKVIQHDR